MTRLLFIHALSPIHCGTGQALGAVDLPVARERATGTPLIPGSSLKGALRAKAREAHLENLTGVFGPETNNASDHAGALVLGDANMLLLPVRSVAGTFAYATSPLLLRRLARDLQEAGLGGLSIPNVAKEDACVVAKDSALRVQDKVLLEDFDFKPSQETADQLATTLGGLLFPGEKEAEARTLFARRICVVHDDVMSYLAEHATQVDARIALDPDTKTVKDGALWYEESLPTETVLVAICAGLRHGKVTPAEAVEALAGLCAGSLQLGGKATVGRGRCRLVLAGGAA
jgi:CRISPR-associated protein Cmr4